MIRKLTEKDRLEVLDYLYQSPSLNIFIIGDIEAFGFETDFQTIYAEFNELKDYLSVLLFYRENVVYYSHIDHFNLEWLNILKVNKHKYFSGRMALIDLVYPHLTDFNYKEMFFAEAKNIDLIPSQNEHNIKKMISRKDAEKVYDLLCSIEEFGVKAQDKEYFIDGKLKALNMGDTYYLEEDEITISTVAATAETTKNAMVIGVATLPLARNRGLASDLMIHLLNEYTKKNKYLCLFYDNPKAGAIYKRLGFKDTEKWVTLDKR